MHKRKRAAKSSRSSQRKIKRKRAWLKAKVCKKRRRKRRKKLVFKHWNSNATKKKFKRKLRSKTWKKKGRSKKRNVRTRRKRSPNCNFVEKQSRNACRKRTFTRSLSPYDGSKPALHAFLNDPTRILEMPTSSDPKISILIILYNKAELTFECLHSIWHHADVPYEIILIDNASSDETNAFINRVRNVTYHRNETNIGFPAAVNQGVRMARGEWVLLLNNDAEITRYMLSHLIRTGEEIPYCGAVGGKLVYPDGRLQEAGSVIWNDGSCLGYGRGDHPDKPEYNFVREVPYVSGACLLIKKQVFMDAGLLDEKYSPAYYDDTDLCMKIRELGYKVIYQPKAVLIHHEFGSSSSEQATQLQERNRQWFRKKWGGSLAQFPAPDSRQVIMGRSINRGQLRLLFIDDRIPAPDLGSGFPRAYDILHTLADIDVEVTFYPFVFKEKSQPWTERLQQKGIEVFYDSEVGTVEFDQFYEERKQYYDAVWISRPHNMDRVIHEIKNRNPNQRIIYDAEAIYAVRDILRMQLQGHQLSEETKQEMIGSEMKKMEHADVVVAVSKQEKDLISKSTGKPVVLVGHSVDNRATTNAMEERADILFVGSLLHADSQNEDAVLYFVRDIFPRIQRELGVKFWIVGNTRLDSIKQLASKHINVVGKVDHFWEYYNRCRVFVNPTRYAAGSPYKVHEAFSHGIPTVTTPLIAEQLGVDENTVLIGRHAEEFAQKVIQCYTNPEVWHRLRQNSLKLVDQKFSKQVYKDRLNQIRTAIGYGRSNRIEKM